VSEAELERKEWEALLELTQKLFEDRKKTKAHNETNKIKT